MPNVSSVHVHKGGEKSLINSVGTKLMGLKSY